MSDAKKYDLDLFNVFEDAIFVHDPVTGQLLDVNDAMLKMYGLPDKSKLEQFVAEQFSATDDGFNQEQVDQKFRQALAGEPITFEWQAKKLTGEKFWVEVSLKKITLNNKVRLLSVCRNISTRKSNEERIKKQSEILARKNEELNKALDNIKIMSGLIPICASCKSIRDDKGFWKQIETFIEHNSEIQFTHGLCPDCAEKLYGKSNKNK